jgi:hypothetical protein
MKATIGQDSGIETVLLPTEAGQAHSLCTTEAGEEVNFVRQRKRVRTLTMPDGSLVKLVEEKTGVSLVAHMERDEGMDALVRPNPIIVPSRSSL